MLNRDLRKVKKAQSVTFPQLDLKKLHVAGYCDAIFASNTDLSSQLGFVVALKNDKENSCLVRYGSWKCERVTRSVLGAETYAFASAQVYCSTLSHDISSVPGKKFLS